ncbi:hypothetical protein, partial [Sphingomonas sp. 66-10]|uniref:hypothetical protein n=1 Tax=Sphingomonas sp. 66-10 TaxID=1895848 RepID=UPI00257FEEC7
TDHPASTSPKPARPRQAIRGQRQVVILPIGSVNVVVADDNEFVDAYEYVVPGPEIPVTVFIVVVDETRCKIGQTPV